ncbi:XkdX family protein [Caproicibacter sp.]
MKFEVLKTMYENKLLTLSGIKKSVKLGFIDADDYKTITGEDYEAI